MPGWVFAVVVIVFLAVAVVLVRRSMKGAIVEHLPLGEDEQVLLEEEGLKVFHRGRKTALRGGWTVTYRMRSALTDRRILLYTGGPAGRHKLVIRIVLDWTTPAPEVSETGYPAYLSKFRLRNGYPTYAFSADDASVADGELRVVVPFAEGGSRWGPPPEVKIVTRQAERYRDAVAA